MRCRYTTPAGSGVIFREDFVNPKLVADNGGQVTGVGTVPTIDHGLVVNQLNGPRIVYYPVGLGATTMTVEVYFKTAADVTTTQDVILAYDTSVSATAAWGLSIAGAQFYARMTDSVLDGWENYPVVPTKEYQMVLVFDGKQATNATRLKLFVDGAPVVATSITGTVATKLSATKRIPMSIAGTSLANRNVAGQQIHRARIYGSALSAADVLALYNGRDPLL